MKLIDAILTDPAFETRPPVLIDIGAADRLNPAWRGIRKHSICVAFDPEPGGLKSIPAAAKSCKQLHIYDSLLTSNGSGSAEFYLTRSPDCSSFLRPIDRELSDWALAVKFDVVEKRQVKTTNLHTVLSELGLHTIDWFKSDSQGTDLRLFVSMGDELLNKVLVAEFEPGIIDAYEGEDKLWQLMEFMDGREFWMSDLKIKGSQWLRREVMESSTGVEKRVMARLLKTSPGWGEVAYMNRLSSPLFDRRDYLLSWVFAFCKKQYGFALHLATAGQERFTDLVFDKMRVESRRAIKRSYFEPSAYFRLAQDCLVTLRKYSRS